MGCSMKLSKERVASRFLTAVRKQFWHGTSSKYLRSILKQGLIPTFKEKQYGGDRGVYISNETFGGIYVTDKLFTASVHAKNAARKTGGNPLFVGMTLETRSPSALPDEDDILPAMVRVVNAETAWDLPDRKSFWGGSFRQQGVSKHLDYETDSGFSILFNAIQNADLAVPTSHFFKDMIEGSPRLGKRYERQKQKLDDLLAEALRAHATHLLFIYHKELGSNQELPPEMQGTFQKMVRGVTKLSKSIREVLDAKVTSRHTARFMSPITYRGKNRIQLVAEITDRKSETVHGWNTYTEIVFHYLQSPSLMSEFLRSVEADGMVFSYRVSYKGKTVKHKIFDNLNQGWPEDLWGP